MTITSILFAIALHAEVKAIPITIDNRTRLMAIAHSPSNEFLALLINQPKQSEALLFDTQLNLTHRFSLPNSARHFALDDANLYYLLTPTVDPRMACRISLTNRQQTCHNLTLYPEGLLIAANHLHVASGGKLYTLDFDTGSTTFATQYTHEIDVMWSFASNNDSVALANGSTGEALLCKVPGWVCNNVSLLSPSQLLDIPNRHPNQLFFTNLTLDPTRIWILADRFNPDRGYPMHSFGPNGQFIETVTLQLPNNPSARPLRLGSRWVFLDSKNFNFHLPSN